MSETIKKNIKLISFLSIIVVLISIIICKLVLNLELFIDKIAYDVLVTELRNPTMTFIMKSITKLSDTLYIILIAILLSILFLIKCNKKEIALLIPSNLIIITLLNQSLKVLFQRERPVGYNLIEASGYSFPSGHAMVSMAFYGLLIYVIYHLVKNKYLRNVLISINIIIIILIGISRVYLGVHFMSDIIAGYCMSVLYLFLFTKLIKKINIFP